MAGLDPAIHEKAGREPGMSHRCGWSKGLLKAAYFVEPISQVLASTNRAFTAILII
jgi:hypothetical protein